MRSKLTLSGSGLTVASSCIAPGCRFDFSFPIFILLVRELENVSGFKFFVGSRIICDLYKKFYPKSQERSLK